VTKPALGELLLHGCQPLGVVFGVDAKTLRGITSGKNGEAQPNLTLLARRV
jgi:hypothetical protein